MTLIIFTVILFGAAAVFGYYAWRKQDGTLEGGAWDAWREMTFVAPRLLVGAIGAGFTAELLPPEMVRAALGAESGSLGILIASAVGAIIPGGPVLVYAVGGAALAAGAGMAQIIAFISAWLLLSATRTMVWEVPIMGFAYVRDRTLLSIAFPLLLGHLAMLVG